MYINIGIDSNGIQQYEGIESPNYGLDAATAAVSEIASEYSERLGMGEDAIWDMFIAAGAVTPTQRAASDLYGQMVSYEWAECHEEVPTKEQWTALMSEMDALWRPESGKQERLI